MGAHDGSPSTRRGRSRKVYRKGRSYLDVMIYQIQQFPQPVQIALVLGSLVTLGFVITNHTAMMDIINVILILKGLSPDSRH